MFFFLFFRAGDEVVEEDTKPVEREFLEEKKIYGQDGDFSQTTNLVIQRGPIGPSSNQGFLKRKRREEEEEDGCVYSGA